MPEKDIAFNIRTKKIFSSPNLCMIVIDFAIFEYIPYLKAERVLLFSLFSQRLIQLVVKSVGTGLNY